MSASRHTRRRTHWVEACSVKRSSPQQPIQPRGPIGIASTRLTRIAAVMAEAAFAKALFGAILMTGFLGGAICTHFRVGEIATAPRLVSLHLRGSAWGALNLRDLRVRALLPLVN
jgi:hypothetical protein